MEALLQVMARAVTRMPKLRLFTAGTTIYDPKLMGATFGFFYLGAGDQQDIGCPEFEHGNVMNRRLLWDVPKIWRMSSALQQLWDITLADDGMIAYQEWDG